MLEAGRPRDSSSNIEIADSLYVRTYARTDGHGAFSLNIYGGNKAIPCLATTTTRSGNRGKVGGSGGAIGPNNTLTRELTLCTVYKLRLVGGHHGADNSAGETPECENLSLFLSLSLCHNSLLP